MKKKKAIISIIIALFITGIIALMIHIRSRNSVSKDDLSSNYSDDDESTHLEDIDTMFGYGTEDCPPPEDDIEESTEARIKLNPTKQDETDNEQLSKELVLSDTLSTLSKYEDFYSTLAEDSKKNNEKIENDLGGDTDDSDIYDNIASYYDSPDYFNTNYEDDWAVYEKLEKNNYKKLDNYIYCEDEPPFDEGDVIMVSDGYLYTALNPDYFISESCEFSAIHVTNFTKNILSVSPGINLRIELERSQVAKYKFKEMYIYNDVLILGYQLELYDMTDNKPSSQTIRSCYEVYDISEKKHPQKIQSVTQSGYYEKLYARDGMLYTVSCFYPNTNTSFYSRKSYEKYIPFVNNEPISPDNIYCSRHLFIPETYVITSIDLNNPDKLNDSKAVSCSEGTIYTGYSGMYLLSSVNDEIEKTEVIKIKLSDGKINVGSYALVSGYMSDPHAISEYNGKLRIATEIPEEELDFYDCELTEGQKNPEYQKYSNILTEYRNIYALYILDDNMRLSGKITGFLPKSQIYSVKFFKDNGYINAEGIDNHEYIIDLSDSTDIKSPKSSDLPDLPELMLQCGKDTFLGIGQKEYPDEGYMKGLKYTLFDTSDQAEVKIKKESTDRDEPYDMYGYGYFMYNHNALYTDPSMHLFGFVYRTEEYDEYDKPYFNYNFITYSYSEDTGFDIYGEFPYDIEYNYDYDIQSVRGFYKDDHFYLVTPKCVECYDLNDPENDWSEYLYFYPEDDE